MGFSRLIQLSSRLAGVLILVVAIYAIQANSSVFTAGTIIHWPSLLFILMTLLGITLYTYQVSRIFQGVWDLIRESPSRKERQIKVIEGKLHELCSVYYRSGAHGMEERFSGGNIPSVWQMVIKQVAAKIPTRDIKVLLNHQAKLYDERLTRQQEIFQAMSTMAPSIGVLGTVLGLIKLLADLGDITALGPNMSLALLTTLYGLFVSIALCKPCAARMGTIRDIHLKSYEQAAFWLDIIAEKKPAFYLAPNYEGRPKKTSLANAAPDPAV